MVHHPSVVYIDDNLSVCSVAARSIDSSSSSNSGYAAEADSVYPSLTTTTTSSSVATHRQRRRRRLRVVGSCVLHALHGHHVKLINPHPTSLYVRRHGHDPAITIIVIIGGDLTNRCGDLFDTTHKTDLLLHWICSRVKRRDNHRHAEHTPKARSGREEDGADDEEVVEEETSGLVECSHPVSTLWYSSRISLWDHIPKPIIIG